MIKFQDSKIYNVTMIVLLYAFIVAWLAGITAVVIGLSG